MSESRSAWMALSSRLTSTCSTWVASTASSPMSSSKSVSMRIPQSVTAGRTRRRALRATSARSAGPRRSADGRANSSRRWTVWAIRESPRSSASWWRCRSSSGMSGLRRTHRQARRLARGLLISWATPAARRPAAASFSVRTRASRDSASWVVMELNAEASSPTSSAERTGIRPERSPSPIRVARAVISRSGSVMKRPTTKASPMPARVRMTNSRARLVVIPRALSRIGSWSIPAWTNPTSGSIRTARRWRMSRPRSRTRVLACPLSACRSAISRIGAMSSGSCPPKLVAITSWSSSTTPRYSSRGSRRAVSCRSSCRSRVCSVSTWSATEGASTSMSCP